MTMYRPMRRNSLIGPWGVGAIVPFPNDESLMIAGLDMWRYNNPEDFVIKDERLAKRIGVPELRWPPDYREKNADPDNCHISIPAVRFPRWSYCPFCGTMRETTYYETQPECDTYQWPHGRKCNPKSKRKMIPERFIVVCPEGHVDDFPIGEWVHFDSGKTYDREKCRIRRSTVNEETPEDEYRFAEYKVLSKTSGNDAQEFHSINHSIDEYDEVIHKYFKSISLIPKLKETRAFVGFSRLKPNSKTISENKKMLRLGEGKWVPAIETYGEGIFFEFNEQYLSEWAKRPEVMSRIRKVAENYKNSFFGQGLKGEVRPEYMLIHTFAHLIINQLSFECGYGSSSIRERLYCEIGENNYNMAGVLIYTASGDAEGSLGGLVRQGEKGRIEDTIISALKNALWCTSDPVCIQSSGQGTDSCNLAACHNCAILPETCCENGNRLLDRGVVIGTLFEPHIGFFSDVRDIE